MLISIFLWIGGASSQESAQQGQELNRIFGNRPEVCFEFNVAHLGDVNKLSKIISIDRVDGLKIKAYANKQEFAAFREWDLDYLIIPAPGLANPVITKEIGPLNSPNVWDAYPTYSAYESMMTQFQTDHPTLCKVQNIGTLASSRKILMARISSNVTDSLQNKPQFLWVSSIHGNETTGYILMLRLIDYLLTNYGTNPQVTNLLDHAEIFINPLTNPDGTYFGGNNSVNQATRYNSNGVDLNRNFPDPQAGQHPDGNAWQPETVIMMNFANTHHISMGGNFHNGAEVINYPWDTWSNLHADDSWWQQVSREYVDTVHAYGPVGYLTDLDNGITNGYAWYTITGGRQDYMTYFHRSREATFEIGNNNLTPGSTLPGFWNCNFRSLMNYMTQVTYGVHGIVTDSVTTAPLKARVFINGHDHDSSQVWSTLPVGNYYRLLSPGAYNLTYTATGYWPKTVYNVNVVNHQASLLDVKLIPLSQGIPEFPWGKGSNLTVFPNPALGITYLHSHKEWRGDILIEVWNSQSQMVLQEKIKGEQLDGGLPLSFDGISKGLLLIRVSNAYYCETLRVLIP